MRFSDAPFVNFLFLGLLFGFLCLPIFSSPVCLDFSLMLTSLLLEILCLCTEPFRQRPWENLFAEITSEKVVRTSVIYLKMMLENFV